MTQKQTTRSRSKSASRKSTPETSSGNNPVIVTRKKTPKNVDAKPEKDIDTAHNIYRRITRQSIRATASTSLDDWKVDDSITHKSDANEYQTTSEGEIRVSGESWLKTFFKAMFSIFFVFFFATLVIVLNKMCEEGEHLRFSIYTEIKVEYFTSCCIIGLVALWLLYLSLLSMVPIGNSRSVSLSDGFHLRYRCNGILSLVVSTVGLMAALRWEYLTTKLIYDKYYYIIGSSVTLAVLISLIVHLKSYWTKCHLVGNPGNVLFSFVMGREINPRIFGLDVKYFYEFRPGFVSWALLNVIFCYRDWEEHAFEKMNWSLLLCATCQFIYCFDSLLFEGDVISKSFMVNGRFGFVHCFGSQVFVPFLFTLTSRVIQLNKLELAPQCLACIGLLNFVGYVIYRASNSQKNEFRKNPYSTHLSHLKTITTEHGKQLLVGGWWGLLRHPNYLGDIIMSICWSLCAGQTFTICWFYPLYFIVFIVNRCLEDETCCSQKHGLAWDQYKRSVRFRLVPFIF